MKQCRVCGETDHSKLYRDKRCAEGVRNLCYACRYRRYKEYNKEYQVVYQKVYNKTDKYKNRRKELQTLEKKEHKKEYDKKFRQTEDFKEHVKEYMDRYRQSDIGSLIIKVAQAKHRSAKRNQTPPLTIHEKEKIKLYYKIAKYLGSDWQVDHIVPVSKGGLHHPVNLQILSRSANASKKDRLDFIPKPLEYFKL